MIETLALTQRVQTASPQNTKTYSQRDVDQLLEQSRVENKSDRRNFETHIRNQYSSEIKHLKQNIKSK